MAKKIEIKARFDIEDSQVHYVSIAGKFVSILFVNGIQINISRAQLDEIVDGLKRHEHVQEIVALLAE